MTNLHNLHLGILDGADVAQVAAFSPLELAEIQRQLDHKTAILKARKEKIAAALDRKYGEAAHAKRLDAGKDTGSVRLDDGEFQIVADTSKTVKWDQKLLVAALDTMPVETAKHYAKAEYKVDERKFSAAPPDVQALLAPARTVVPGKTTYTIENKNQPPETVA